MRTNEDIGAWSDRIDDAIRAMPGCCVGSVRVYQEVASTQDTAARDAVPRAGVAVVASVQTAGRGSRGRRWDDGVARTLPISMAFETEHDSVGLAARAGLAALDACAAAAPDADVRIKWPNDIIVRTNGVDRKLAGVLIERRSDLAIVGIGVNVFDGPETEHTRGAVALERVGAGTDRCGLAIGLIGAMTRWLVGPDDAVCARWADRDAMVGTERSFVVANEPVRGVVESLDPLGSICVRTTTGVRTLAVTTARTA